MQNHIVQKAGPLGSAFLLRAGAAIRELPQSHIQKRNPPRKNKIFPRT